MQRQLFCFLSCRCCIYEKWLSSSLAISLCTLQCVTDGNTHPGITGFNCNNKGHYSSACTRTTGVQMLQAAAPHYVSHFTFTQPSVTLIPDSWILLDSQSTVSIFCNATLLTDICPSMQLLTDFTNGGQQISTYIGQLANFGPVWYNPQSLANILSLAAVRRSGGGRRKQLFTVFIVGKVVHQGAGIYSQGDSDSTGQSKRNEAGKEWPGFSGPEIATHQYTTFFVMDQITQDGLEIWYCPTESMLADFFTKPLQGNLFRRFCNVILGHAPVALLMKDMSPLSPKERIGTKDEEEHSSIETHLSVPASASSNSGSNWWSTDHSCKSRSYKSSHLCQGINGKEGGVPW